MQHRRYAVGHARWGQYQPVTSLPVIDIMLALRQACQGLRSHRPASQPPPSSAGLTNNQLHDHHQAKYFTIALRIKPCRVRWLIKRHVADQMPTLRQVFFQSLMVCQLLHNQPIDRLSNLPDGVQRRQCFGHTCSRPKNSICHDQEIGYPSTHD